MNDKFSSIQNELLSAVSFEFQPDALLGVIPQDSVRMAEVCEPGHNSSWDYSISPDGHHYFSVCAEALNTGYFRLYEYCHKTNTCKRLVAMEDSAVVYQRAIRASKIHSSLSFLPDGRVLFASHTTAAAPGHARWMPFAYYSHPWEGYPGSNLFLFDPKSQKVEDLGIPVQRESIYGGIYETLTNSFYFVGYLRGHFYRFDLDTRKVTDFGQATEFGTWRIIPGTDGNLYGTTASGRLWKFNIEKQFLEDVPQNLPFDQNLIRSGTNNKVMHYANHPNGCLYFTTLSSTHLFRFDYKTQQIMVLDSFVPYELLETKDNVRCMGMAVDTYGVLWYLCERVGFGTYLVRWNPDGATPPENMGLIGTKEHIVHATFGCFIHEDRLYWNDTNRAETSGVAVFQAELSSIRKYANFPKEVTLDPLVYMVMQNGAEVYNQRTGKRLLDELEPELCVLQELKHQSENEVYQRTMPLEYDEEKRKNFYGDDAVNATHFPTKTRWVAKIWQMPGYYNARIRDVSFDEKNIVCAIVEKNGNFEKLQIKDGKVVHKEPTSFNAVTAEQLKARFSNIELPWQAERRHLAYPSATAAMANGNTLIGTQDGMIALLKPDGTVFSLGAVGSCGPIHSFAVSPDGRAVFGTAGDKNDLGTIFRFDLNRGLTIYGRLFFHDPNSEGLIGASNEPTSIAWSGDGKQIAIGVEDKLGCVYCFELLE